MARYDQRLATRISKPVDRRLRVAVALDGPSLSAFLDQVLDKVLPSADELAARLTEDGQEAVA